MTTAGTDLSLQSVVDVFSRYLLVKAVMALVAFSKAMVRSSSVMPADLSLRATPNLVVLDDDNGTKANPLERSDTAQHSIRVIDLVILLSSMDATEIIKSKILVRKYEAKRLDGQSVSSTRGDMVKSQSSVMMMRTQKADDYRRTTHNYSVSYVANVLRSRINPKCEITNSESSKKLAW
jgi:hypothetical protein